jgi:hypothetical protein
MWPKLRFIAEHHRGSFLGLPAVMFLSESCDKVVPRDDGLAKKFGIDIFADKNVPDIILADLSLAHSLLVSVEIVANARRRYWR